METFAIIAGWWVIGFIGALLTRYLVERAVFTGLLYIRPEPLTRWGVILCALFAVLGPAAWGPAPICLLLWIVEIVRDRSNNSALRKWLMTPVFKQQ